LYFTYREKEGLWSYYDIDNWIIACDAVFCSSSIHHEDGTNEINFFFREKFQFPLEDLEKTPTRSSITPSNSTTTKRFVFLVMHRQAFPLLITNTMCFLILLICIFITSRDISHSANNVGRDSGINPRSSHIDVVSFLSILYS